MGTALRGMFVEDGITIIGSPGTEGTPGGRGGGVGNTGGLHPIISQMIDPMFGPPGVVTGVAAGGGGVGS